MSSVRHLSIVFGFLYWLSQSKIISQGNRKMKSSANLNKTAPQIKLAQKLSTTNKEKLPPHIPFEEGSEKGILFLDLFQTHYKQMDRPLGGYFGRNPSKLNLKEIEKRTTKLPESATAKSVHHTKKELLFQAVKNNDMESIQQLLKGNIFKDIYLPNKNGETLLQEVCKHGNLEILKELVTYEALSEEAMQPDTNGDSPLHLAALSQNTEFVEYLIDTNLVDVALQNNEGSTPMHLAALNGNENLVLLFFHTKPLSLKIENKFCENPLDFCRTNNLNCTKELIRKCELLDSCLSKRCILGAESIAERPQVKSTGVFCTHQGNKFFA